MRLYSLRVNSILTTLVPKSGITFFPPIPQCIVALPALHTAFPYTRVPLNQYLIGPSSICLVSFNSVSLATIVCFSLYFFFREKKKISFAYLMNKKTNAFLQLMKYEVLKIFSS